MHDPFPLSPPPLLARLTTTYLAKPLNFSTLPLHIHEILLLAVFYQFIYAYVSPFISSLLLPKVYPQLPWRTKLNWDVHVVSLIQCCSINALAIYIFIYDEERKGIMAEDWRTRIWGYTGALGLVEAVAVGYFLWDLIICTVHIKVFGAGMLAHAVSALAVYLFGFRPFVNAYAPIFILYELSSPFLNVHWFCDKLNLTGSSLQLYNGILLITSFFFSRLVWGIWNTWVVFGDIFRALDYQHTHAGKAWLADVATRVVADAATRAQVATGGKLPGVASAAEQVLGTAIPRPIPKWLAVLYLSANATLTLLNVYWFGQMIKTIRARFEPPFGTKKVEKGKKEK